MTQFQHRDLSPGNIHGIFNWEVADNTARDALTVTSDDIGKVVKVGASTLYWLSAVSPTTWSEMGGGGGGGYTEAALVKTFRASLAFGTSSPLNIGSALPAGATVSRILVNVTTAFNASSTVTFGVSGQLTELGAASENDLTTVGVYTIEGFKTYSGGEQIIATYTPAGASVGAASIEVHYSIV